MGGGEEPQQLYGLFLSNKIAFSRVSSKSHKLQAAHPQNMCGMLGAPWIFQATPTPFLHPKEKKRKREREREREREKERKEGRKKEREREREKESKPLNRR